MEPTQIEGASASVSNQPLKSSSVEPTGKKPNGLIFGVVFCVILAIAGVVFGAYEFMDANQKAQQISNLKSQIESHGGNVNLDDLTVTFEDPTQDDSNVRELINLLQTVVNETTGKASIKIYDENIITKNEGFKTILPIDKSYGVYSPYTDDLSSHSEVVEAITNKLKELGFIDNPEINGPGYLVGHANMINNDSGIICNISNSLLFKVSCGHSSWVSDEAVALANDLSDAYYAAENAYPFSINTKISVVKDSSVSPYQTLRVPVSNAMGLFYRTSPDSDWQFFTGTQSELACSEFNTQDLKNAFAGETCYDGDQKSTVQP